MPEPLIFYDIPNKHSGQHRAWSPNTWKVRLALNYKRIPYRTVWVEYPDIQPLCLAIGAVQTTGGYTLPIIHDPNTDRVVSDSWEIVKYLDAQYPERAVIPAGQDGLQYAFMFSPIHLVRLHACLA
jgi:glutathione S-transferase